MSIQDKIANICLAFKFAILDYAYSKNEVLELIKNSELLSKEIGDPKTETELTEIIKEQSTNGDINESTKIIIELLRKKTSQKDFRQVIKTLDTLCWLHGLEKYKTLQIEELIDLHENENFVISNAQIEKINECVESYKEYDI